MRGQAGKAWRAVLLVVFLLLLAAVLGTSLFFFLDTPPGGARKIHEITQVRADVDGKVSEISLPYTFHGLKAGTDVTISFDLSLASADNLYVKNVYSPLLVRQDGKVLLRYGEKEARPAFMADPACGIWLIPIQASGQKASHVEISYRFPSSRDSLPLYCPMAGGVSGFFRYRRGRLWSSLGLSIFFLIVGGGSGFYHAANLFL